MELELYRILIIVPTGKSVLFNYSKSESLDSTSELLDSTSASKDIILFLNNYHFTLLEPVDSSITIDTLVLNDGKLELANKQIELMQIDPARISTSVALLGAPSEANSSENFGNKATNGKKFPHLYMVSTFSHLLYNISAIFADEIKGIIYSIFDVLKLIYLL